jgi:glycosyltransferase involved in cell wall biosynthesis
VGWKERCKSLLARAFRPNPEAQARRRARAILRVIEAERCDALVACSGDLIDIPAAWQAAQQARVPFIPYLFDDYYEQWTVPWQRRFAQKVFPPIVQGSAGVIVPNEFLARSYLDRFGVQSVVVPNPITEAPARNEPTEPAARRPLRIVYTGAIYEAHFDSFLHLQDAVRQSPAGAFELHVYTAMDRRFLAQHGIGAPAFLHAAVNAEQARHVQSEADLLFLPLAFHSPFPDVIRTSAPGKMGELLASGRPVLVHAPRDSFVSSYCRDHACAIVVDEPSPAALQQALAGLLHDPAATAHMVQAARKRALTDFSLEIARARFFQVLAG